MTRYPIITWLDTSSSWAKSETPLDSDKHIVTMQLSQSYDVLQLCIIHADFSSMVCYFQKQELVGQ